MARYTTSADGPLDADRGSGSVGTKRAEFVQADEYQARAMERLGALEQDQMVEAMPARAGMTRQGRDSLRAFPRATTAEPGHPVMVRRLPEPDAVRVPLSSRQRKARSVSKRAVLDELPSAQHQALAATVGDPGTWRAVNDELSEHTGDAVLLGERTQQQVRRLDRAIQAYERENDRGHVVYANVRLPRAINHSNLEAFVKNQFTDGQVVAFDRYTGGAQTLHQVSGRQVDTQRSCVFEIQTRRGMYLGRSDGVDDTAHLLPRGMRLRVAGAHQARYRRPDGTQGTRMVVQLVDVTETDDTNERT